MSALATTESRTGIGPKLVAFLRNNRAWRRFRRHKLAVVGAIVLFCLVMAALLAPFIAPYHPNRQSLLNARKPPSEEHRLGTDTVGRDVLSRIIFAGRVSLGVGLGAVLVYTFVGTLLGSIAGYYGGRIENLIMRVTDAVLCFPPLIISLAFVAAIGPSVWIVMVAIALLRWPAVCRIVRAQLLSLREREFVEAARAIGAPSLRIIFRHLLPNVVGPITVAATFGMAEAILMEAWLSFLGFGVQPPTATWGNMLSDAQSLTVLRRMPWLWMPPGVMILVTVLSINFVGDGLRDALDPRARPDA